MDCLDVEGNITSEVRQSIEDRLFM
ncbi:hypothetical protein [Calothrix sp. UHCC 0171]